MPRVLFVNFSKGWGGLELFSANLFEWMSEYCEIRFIVNEGSKLERHLSTSAYAENVVSVSSRRYFSPRSTRAIRDTVRKADIDLIHTFSAGDLYHLTGATRKPDGGRVKIILHLQMLPHSSRRDPVHAWLYRRLDLLLTITKQIQERVWELWPVRREIVRAVYYGIEVDRFSADGIDARAVKRQYDLPEDARVLGIIGNICENKGQLFVLEVFHSLADEYPNLVMLMAGGVHIEDAAYAEEISRYVAEHGLEDRVRRLEFTEDIAALLSTFDVFVLGSIAEAFGFVVIEAMAAGRVVAGSRAGGVPEIITHGEDGFLYESQNADSLRETLRQALDLQPDERARMTENAKSTVSRRFSRDRMLRDVRDIYEELTA